MKYYIFKPKDGIDSLCTSMLDEMCFQELVTVVEGGKKISGSAWEVGLGELRDIHHAAVEKAFDMNDFKVAVPRTRSKQTLRWAKKEEWNKAHQSRKNRFKNLRRIIGERVGKWE